eukprot:103205-Prymnesium_polylepis.1
MCKERCPRRAGRWRLALPRSGPKGQCKKRRRKHRAVRKRRAPTNFAASVGGAHLGWPFSDVSMDA